jgi:membrane protease YdiL (CAAX protease family)
MGLGVRRLGHAIGDLAAGAMLAIPTWIATIIAVAIAFLFLHHTADNPLPPATEPSALAVNLVTAAVLAPIAEEIFFRGFATTAWAATLGPDQALARGAIFFAFVHVFNASGVTFGDALAEAAMGFVARIPVGFALGWIYLRRRSLFAAIGLHSAFNAIQVVLAYAAAT